MPRTFTFQFAKFCVRCQPLCKFPWSGSTFGLTASFAIAGALALSDASTQDTATPRRLDAATVLKTNHTSNLAGVTTETYPGYLFGDEINCVLAPDTTQEPFFVSGEVYRQDLVEDQAGVSLTTVMRFIDVETCAPVNNLWISFWNSNAKGVYSGVVGAQAGASDDAANQKKTFLRGLVQTDMYGLATFKTIFPGHYSGRAPHLNVLTQYNGAYLGNKTYTGGLTVHVGEIFFDQDLITKVKSSSAYSSNTQNLTANAENKGLAEAAANDYDPVAVYSQLGDTVEDGILAWIFIGINLSAHHNVTAAGSLLTNDTV